MEELGVVLLDVDVELEELVLEVLEEALESELVDEVDGLASDFFASLLVEVEDFLSRESFR